MSVTSVSRNLAIVSALAMLSACNDAYSPTQSSGPSSPTGLTVVPRQATIQAGQVVALKARLSDDNGDQIRGVAITWTSSDEKVATVAATGEVLGRSAGHSTIAASVQGKTQTSFIKVTGRATKPEPEGEN
jgi:pullulanase